MQLVGGGCTARHVEFPGFQPVAPLSFRSIEASALLVRNFASTSCYVLGLSTGDVEVGQPDIYIVYVEQSVEKPKCGKGVYNRLEV